METIRMYLENMFKSLPLSVETERAKQELLSIMEDKYLELKSTGKSENEAIGIVISEFGNISELIDELGLIQTIEPEQHTDYTWEVYEDENDGLPTISLQNAKEYLEETGRNARNIALGVALCVASPALLVVLSGDVPGFSAFKSIGIAAGLLVMFIFVAVGVGNFIFVGMRHERFEKLKTEPFGLDFSAEAYVREDKEQFRTVFAASITAAVVLFILACVPLVVVSIVTSSSFLICLATGLLLAMVSIGVGVCVLVGMRWESYSVILQENEYSLKKKKKAKKKLR